MKKSRMELVAMFGETQVREMERFWAEREYIYGLEARVRQLNAELERWYRLTEEVPMISSDLLRQTLDELGIKPSH